MSGLGEGEPHPWEQLRGSCQVPLQPSCQGLWTHHPGGEWIYCNINKLWQFSGCLLIPHGTREGLNYVSVLLLLCVQQRLVARGFASVSRVCLLAQIVWEGSLSSRTLPQLPSKAPLSSFPQILYMSFCTLLLQFLPTDSDVFSSLPDVVLRTCSTADVLATRLQ